MPMINVEIGAISESVKKRLLEKLTDVSAEITGIPKSSFYVSIRELSDDNIAIGGKSVRQQKEDYKNLYQ